MDIRMLRLGDVLAKTGLSRTAMYDDAAVGLFTKPVKIGARAAAWPAHEVDAVLRARLSGKSNEQLRALVRSLHAARIDDDL
ncbi:AlpA family transcriptional regulator [Herminiimonas sp. CN]|uniref:helix-turn-helix transcriptional regulator n=1 Tax=Herminiimonas sp. CN TaxID=1349818 RepID=UPI000474284D|nr:AlpA family phage regulatory protein [Herminiimonas sp. CN]